MIEWASIAWIAVSGLAVALGFSWLTLRQRGAELQKLNMQLADKEQRITQLQQSETALQTEAAILRGTLQQSERAAAEKLALLNDAKQQLSHEFQVLAQRIFEEKSERFAQQNKTNIDGTLNPLREQLSEFRQRVDAVYDKDNQDRTALRVELQHLKELNQRMSQEALNLTRALKGDNKAQGNWGEVVLERVLEESGLRKGHEYETQLAITSDEGRRRYPDVVVHLPDNKDIVIDAKVALVNYERYCSAEDEAERAAALRLHVAAVRAHIDGLSVKQYENLPGIRSLDFVLIFIPIEAAFLVAFENDPALFSNAYEKNIIVVSPTTLLATLRTVQTIWRYERQNNNAELIAKQAGALHDQFALVLEALQDIGRFIDKSHSAYELTVDRLARGKGNMVKRVNDLAKLGAKTKRTLPSELLDNADDEVERLPGKTTQDDLISE
jgi:DNA recombination protein RmuC